MLQKILSASPKSKILFVIGLILSMLFVFLYFQNNTNEVPEEFAQVSSEISTIQQQFYETTAGKPKAWSSTNTTVNARSNGKWYVENYADSPEFAEFYVKNDEDEIALKVRVSQTVKIKVCDRPGPCEGDTGLDTFQFGFDQFIKQKTKLGTFAISNTKASQTQFAIGNNIGVITPADPEINVSYPLYFTNSENSDVFINGVNLKETRFRGNLAKIEIEYFYTGFSLFREDAKKVADLLQEATNFIEP